MNYFKNIVTAMNPMHWSLQQLLIVGGVAWLVLTLLAVEPIARMTVLKKFYQNVALAASYSDELPFNHFVTKTQSSEGTNTGNSRRSGLKFNNCSSTGTYWNNVTNRTIHGAFTCSRNFISYYGIEDFSSQTVDGARKKMISLGWTEVGDEADVDDKFKTIQEQTDGTVRGFSFKRGDNVNASIVFISRGSADYQDWCHNLRDGCRVLEQAGAPYATLMAVNISAYKGYED